MHVLSCDFELTRHPAIDVHDGCNEFATIKW